MNFSIVFRNQGRHIWIVQTEYENFDVETGEHKANHKFKRVLALIGSDSHSYESFLDLKESMIVLEEEATLVVFDDKIHVTTLVKRFQSLYIYKLDKVEGNEYSSILGQVPT